MSIKKIVARITLGAMTVGALSIGVFGAVTSATQGVDTGAVVNAVAVVADFIGPDKASALTSSGGVVSIESSDLVVADQSVNNLLKTAFEVLKLLPLMALILGGFYLLDKVLGILPRPGSGGGK